MKLFKKVAAAVLAGAMALSMVACGTTPVVDPTEPDTPVTPANAETTILGYMNTYRTTANGIVDAAQVESDATLKAQAQALADIVAADPNTNNTDCAIWTTYGEVVVPVQTLNSKLQFAGVSANLPTFYVITEKGDVKEVKAEAYTIHKADVLFGLGYFQVEGTADLTVLAYKFNIEQGDLVYSLTQNAKQQLAAAGFGMGQNVQKIGAAASTVRGKQCVIVASKTALDPAVKIPSAWVF